MIRAYRVLNVGVLLWAGCFSLASADTFTVNSLLDEVDTNTADNVCSTASGCTLRAAIQQANATEGADVIELANGAVYNFSLAGKEDAALAGDLDVHSEITINGNRAVIDAMQLDRVFQVHGDGTLVLNEMTVRNGLAEFGSGWGGGGIDVSGGQLTVNDSNITFNVAATLGGGISNFNGAVTLNRSVVDQNVSDGQGGGIFNQDGPLTINHTLISANGGQHFLGGGIYNSAMMNVLEINSSTIVGHDVLVDGGGIYHLLGSLKITNSTISGNSAGRNGGGLFLHNGNSIFGGVTHELRNVTIAHNGAAGSATDDPANGKGGSGLYVEGRVLLKTINTIIANSTTAKEDCYFDGVGAEIDSLSSHHNLDTDGSCFSADTTSFSPAEVAVLEPLANNGGVTPTHALSSNSEALDGGSCLEEFDQRDFTRPAAGCDIGAYEEGATPPVNGFAPLPASQGSSSSNVAPVTFNQSVVVNAGGVVVGVLRASYVDGNSLSYIIVQPPTKGDVGRVGSANVPGEFAFEYTASTDATGSDSFTFKACDGVLCSEPATVSISIGSEPVSGEMVIELAPGSSATVSPLSVAAPSNLDATASDLDYSKPFGVFYFDVQNIPTAANLESGTVVVIQLPPESVISADAVIRKLDVTGAWQILPSEPSAVESSGVIDVVAKTLTLTLRDNDRFDTNPELGVIRDPVAISVLKSVDPSVQDLQATVAVPSNNAADSDTVVVDEPAEQQQTEVTVVASNGDSGGSAAFNPLMLVWLGLLVLLRRKSC